MNRLRLNSVIPTWLSGGIFSVLQGFDVPWKSLNIESFLDYEYHGNISGDKFISPLVNTLITSDGTSDVLSSEDLLTLAGVIYHLFNVAWVKEYSTLSLSYSPLQNYDMTENMTNDQTITAYGHTDTRTDTLDHTKTGVDTSRPNFTDSQTNNLTHTKTGTETETPGTTVNESNNIFGFNSATAVPSDTHSQTVTGSNQKSYNLSEGDGGSRTLTHTGSETTEYNTTDSDRGTVAHVEGGQNTETRNYQLSRSGNIGVTTSQQMLQAERDVWMWNFFHSVVFPDVDKILTLQIY